MEGESARIKGMPPGSATLSPPQTTARLASLVDFFFRARQPFSPFSRKAEPGPRLVPGSKGKGKRFKESCEKTTWELGRDKEVEPASIVFNTS